MIIYIAGPITKVENYKENFEKAEELLKQEGHTVLNPLVLPEGLTYEQYMKIDLAMVEAADVVYMLRGWDQSRGANAEFCVARCLGKEVWFE